MRTLHCKKNRFTSYSERISGRHGRRFISLLLCLCMIMSMMCSFGESVMSAAASPTADEYIMSRIADGDTTDAYADKLLSGEWGSRYAGRVWTDKSVFKFGDDIDLDMKTDGYNGKVKFNSDFGTVFSALTSSQEVNEWPPSPIDLVIAIDMSASMAQDTRYAINSVGDSNDANSYIKAAAVSDRTMDSRIKNSRIQKTLDAVNETIDALMAQNRNNRVSVVAYGAGATELLPLAHYERCDADNDGEDDPYLTVGGMETLYKLEDLKVDSEYGWVWTRNIDACYTIVANARKNTENKNGFVFDKNEIFTKTVSNNVDNRKPKTIDGATERVKAYPGYETWKNADKSKFNDEPKQLAAETYVGYFTNTQGGIYLAYAQLAQAKDTTFTGTLSTGDSITVARIPAAIIMTDGGANFAFNEMSDWDKYYGAYTMHGKNDEGYNGSYNTEERQTPPYFRHDNSSYDYSADKDDWNTGHDNLDASHRLGENKGDEWYKVYLPGELGDAKKITSLYNSGMVLGNGTLSTEPGWYNAGVFYSNDSDLMATGGTILQLLITASYMKSVVKNHYIDGWDQNEATTESRTDLQTFTMSVDSKNVPQWGRLRLYPSMDPKNYLFSDAHWKDDVLTSGPGTGNIGTLPPEKYIPGFERAVNSWEEWKNNGFAKIMMTGDNAEANINKLPDDYKDERFNVSVSNQDVIDNIVYTDGFYDIESSDIISKFAQILTEISGNVFIPISGDNDAGVGNSITYQDPLGKYMELKHQAIDTAGQNFDMSLLLFGKMHGMVRAGVYDYQWNDKWMTKNNEDYNGDRPFEQGWYFGDDPLTEKSAQQLGIEINNDDSAGSYPKMSPDKSKECKSAEQAWAYGWVFRFNYRTMLTFVPINANIELDTPPNKLPDQLKNTVYTCYRFADSQEDRNSLNRNPAYGEEIPEELQAVWKRYEETGSYPVGMDDYSRYPGVYRLSDIRVWEEHTGDFVDQNDAITPEDKGGYDDSLYVNIPVAAAPTQVAEITLGPGGPISYKTNLGDDHAGEANANAYYAQSTPFRLFYAVGLAEELIQRDSDGNQTGVDISKISGEYIANHSDPETNNIYFVSNWYSNTIYRGYTSDESNGYSTRGDAAVTFSVNERNHYYLFQKPLPLFAHAWRVTDDDGNIAPVDRKEDESFNGDRSGNGGTTWETVTDSNGNKIPQSASTWAGGEFIGTYTNKASFSSALSKAKAEDAGYITDEKGYSYPLPKNIKDAVITLSEEQLKKVRSASEDDGGYTDGSISFSSDDYFFLCIEYYVPVEGVGKDINGREVKGTNASRKVTRVVARKGSEFGSGLHSENIKNGDMLCWSDINGNCTIEIEYSSRTETGDNTRGEPTFEKLTYSGEKLKEYLRSCGLKDDVQVTWTEGDEVRTGTPLERDVEYWERVQSDPHIKALVQQMTTDTAEKHPVYDKLFDWSVSARTGGIRVGDMYQNVQPKGGNTNFKEDEDGNQTRYYEGNLTETANNYYIPTLSETSTAGEGLIIDNYLGNNGRLEIMNSMLMVTKTLVAPDGFNLTRKQQDETFLYQVYIDNVTGVRLAQRLKWNPFSQSWQKRVETMDILTDNSSLVMDTNGSRAIFCYANGKAPKQVVEVVQNGVTKYYYADANGAATDEECNDVAGHLYYMYLPDEEGQHTYRLFASDYETGTADIKNVGTTAYYPADMDKNQLPEGDNGNQRLTPEITDKENPMENRPAGSREYWTSAAILIPCREVQEAERPLEESSGEYALEAEADNRNWSYEKKESHKPLDKFTLVTVIPDPEGIDSTVYSSFNSQTQYMTAELNFGMNTNKNDGSGMGEITVDDLYDQIIPSADRPDLFGKKNNEGIAKNTAEFTLKHGEGLLFTGLGNRIAYRFTEKLTEKQMKYGYTLKEISHVQQRGSDSIYRPGVQEIPVYSVFGDTDYFTEQANYINTIDPEMMVLTKKLVDDRGNEVQTPPNQEFEFTLEFKPDDSDNIAPTDTTLYYWKGDRRTMTGGQTWTDDMGEVHRMPESAPKLTEYANYLTGEFTLMPIKPDSEGKYTIRLKADEAAVFYGMLAGMNYTVTEKADSQYPVVNQGTPGTEPTEGNPVITGTIKRAQQNPVEITPLSVTVNRADFTNLMQGGSLTVEKRIMDDDRWDVNKTFEFTITLAAEGGKFLSPSNLTVIQFIKAKDETETQKQLDDVEWKETRDADDNVTELTAIFTLKHGERIFIDGIPYGTKYKVAESNRNGYYLEHVADNSYDEFGENGGHIDIDRTNDSVNGIVTKDNAEAYLLFINARPLALPFTGSLNVWMLYGIGAVVLTASFFAVFAVRCRKRGAI